MPDQHSQQYWMAQAIKLARRGLYSTHPNPRVGCVVVRQNQLIAQGWHEYTGGPHAEVSALSQNEIPVGCDIYVSLEPCSHQGRTGPCVDALIKRQPARVIIAMQDPNPLVAGSGINKLKSANIEVITGVLEVQARELNCGFVSRLENNKPFVRLKMATSLDGKTALNNGESQWITGESARRDVQFLRARASAILTTATTVLSDNPSLNLRLSRQELNQDYEVRQPVRVIIDSKLRLTGEEKLFKQGGPVWIYTLNKEPSKRQALEAAGATVILSRSTNSGQLDLEGLTQDMAKREINEVHSECGQSLAGALMKQGLVDELVIYMAPTILGQQARGAFDIGELVDMNEQLRCNINEVRNIGDDLRITLTPESRKSCPQ